MAEACKSPNPNYDHGARPQSRRGQRVVPGDRPKTRSHVSNVFNELSGEPDKESKSFLSHSRPMTTMPESRSGSVLSGYSAYPVPTQQPHPPAVDRPLLSRVWNRPVSRSGRLSSQDFDDFDDSEDDWEMSNQRPSSSMSRPLSTARRRPTSSVGRVKAAVRPPSASSLSRYSVLPAIGQTVDELDAGFKTLSVNSDNVSLQSTHDDSTMKTVQKSESEIIRKPPLHINIPHGQKESETDSATQVSSSNNIPLTDLIKATANQDSVADKHIVEESNISSTKSYSLPTEPCENEERILLAVKLPEGDRFQRYFRLTDTLQDVLNFAESKAQTNFDDHELVSTLPRRVFTDLSVTVGESGIFDRTVLYVQLPEM